MSKDMKLIPELRFPEFEDDGEWVAKSLKNVSHITMGSSPKSASYNKKQIGLPLLQGNADIKNRLSAPRIYTSEVTKECEIDDILLSVRAPVGTVAKSIHRACIGRGISAIRAKDKNSQEFLYQWLFSFESAWKNISQGGTFDAVNSDDIRNLKIPIPQPQEQQKIAACLSSLDELIAAHNDKLDALKDHKKGLLQNLFPNNLNHDSKGLKDDHDLENGRKSGDQANPKNHGSDNVPKVRFPEFVGDGEWELKELGKVAEIITGNTPSTKEPSYYGGEKMFVSSADISDNRIVSETNTTLTELGFSKTRQIESNSVLFVCIGSTIGKVAQNKYECATNQQINSLIAQKGYYSNFLYSLLDGNSKQIASIAGNHAVPIINKTSFSAVKLPFPPSSEEQQKIASCLSSVDELIAAQKEKIGQLQQHKKGLMQGLFPNVVG